MKKIIVLGSNSFAGSCYIDYLLNKNYQIYGFSRSDEPSKLLLKYKFNKNIANFKFIKFDINNDLNLLKKFIKRNKVDYIPISIDESLDKSLMQYLIKRNQINK